MNLIEVINPILVIVGLLLILTELVVGLDSLFDLVLSGLSMMLGGLIGLLFGNSWQMGLLLSILFLIGYWFAGRTFLRNRLAKTHINSNVDNLIGQTTKIEKVINGHKYLIKIDGETWTAKSDEKLTIGEEVKIVAVDTILTIQKLS